MTVLPVSSFIQRWRVEEWQEVMQCYINRVPCYWKNMWKISDNKNDFGETGMCHTSGRPESVSNFMNHAHDCRTWNNCEFYKYVWQRKMERWKEGTNEHKVRKIPVQTSAVKEAESTRGTLTWTNVFVW